MPTKKQLKTYHSAGHRNYRAIARAKAAKAEVKAKAAAGTINIFEETENIMTINQSLEDDVNCHSQALFVEDVNENVLRLWEAIIATIAALIT